MNNERTTTSWSVAGIVTALAIYACLLAAIVGGMRQAREAFLNSPHQSQERQDWQTWRDQVEKQSQESGPVQRKVPKSAEPPGLVMLRDHFGACLAAVILISSTLYGVLVFLLQGVLNSPRSSNDTDQPQGASPQFPQD